MFDEPVNGLDPEGILGIRNLMKGLAAEGRTVFVSSHLMAEMQHTADHLLVIGRGRMIADCTTAEFIARSSVLAARVRTTDAVRLAALLSNHGAVATIEDDGSLTVTEMSLDRIGDLAFDAGPRLHELATRQASLEEAFMELTRDSVEYLAAL